MFNILTNNGRVAYGIKKYMVSTVDEIKTIPITSGVASGSQVLVTSTGDQYILDLNRKWVKLSTYSGAGEILEDEIIYEGGDLSDEIAEEEVNYNGGNV